MLVDDVVSAFLGGAASVRSQLYSSVDITATTSSLPRIIVSWIQCLGLMGATGTRIEECVTVQRGGGSGRCTAVICVCWSTWDCRMTN